MDGHGNLLFAGAGLAFDQDGRGSRGHAPDQVEDGLHARAAADDLVERIMIAHWFRFPPEQISQRNSPEFRSRRNSGEFRYTFANATLRSQYDRRPVATT